jgi:Ser/Thr protein kinase RdoA (MazF antagonist)
MIRGEKIYLQTVKQSDLALLESWNNNSDFNGEYNDFGFRPAGSSEKRFADDLLVQAAQVIRRYHDITAGSVLAQDHEIVAHHELGPHNTLFQENWLVGFIDWDDASPGTRLRDLANAVYNYVDVGHWANQTADEQARRVHLMCAAYGWDDPIARSCPFLFLTATTGPIGQLTSVLPMNA